MSADRQRQDSGPSDQIWTPEAAAGAESKPTLLELCRRHLGPPPAWATAPAPVETVPPRPPAYDAIEDARLKARDLMFFGTAFTDVSGRRIDPAAIESFKLHPWQRHLLELEPAAGPPFRRLILHSGRQFGRQAAARFLDDLFREHLLRQRLYPDAEAAENGMGC